MPYKSKKFFIKAFGLNEIGMVDFPTKYSNVNISRYVNQGNGCDRCFPHGCETYNSKANKYQKNWKKYRKQQWK